MNSLGCAPLIGRKCLKRQAFYQKEIKAHLENENDYAAALLKPAAALEKEILAEMKARIPDEDKETPLPHDNFFYWHAFAQGQEQPCFFRQNKDGDKDGENKTLLLNADALSQQYDFFRLGDACHSDDHLYFAYAADVSGGEFYNIVITEIASGKIIDEIKNCDGSFVWIG